MLLTLIIGAPVRSSIRIHRNISISNVFDYWFRHIIDTGSEPQRTPFSVLLALLLIVCACAGDEVIIPDIIDHPMKRLIAGGVAGSSTLQSDLVLSIHQPSLVSD